MSIGRLLELAGVNHLPKAKQLIEQEQRVTSRLFVATDLVVDLLKPGRYQQGRGEFLTAYASKDQAVENANRLSRRSRDPIMIYEVDASEFPHRSGDAFQTMFFVTPIRRYPA